MIGFSFEFDWLKEWCEFSRPITEQNKAKTKRQWLLSTFTRQVFLWHDISSITRDFRDNRLTVLNGGYKKLFKDGDWGGVSACSLSVLYNLSGTIPR